MSRFGAPSLRDGELIAGEKPEVDDFHLKPAEIVTCMTHFFRTAEDLLDRYNAEEIDRGIHKVVDMQEWGDVDSLWNPDVPLGDRLACIDAISDLYAGLYAKHCPEQNCHLDLARYPDWTPALNKMCYMFWYVAPLSPKLGDLSGKTFDNWLKLPDGYDTQDEVDDVLAIKDACLKTMKKTLQLDHTACQEGALHGLGHWHRVYPKRVESIVSEFLEGERTPEIRALAERARYGRVPYIA